MAMGEGGAVYTWGDNDDGQLGLGDHGDSTNRNVPTEVPGLNGMVAVAAGSNHSLALSKNGTVMTCGSNDDGQLGLGDTDDRDTFTVVAGLRGVVDIDAGRFHSIAVTAERGLYTWGGGQAIGHGGNGDTQYLVPTKVTGGGIGEAAVVQVAAGFGHTMALTASGELYAWGQGENGQLGHGGKEHLAVPRVVGGIGEIVVGISGGEDHSLVITAEGRVLAFGCNGEEQEEDSDGEELEEPVVVDGRLGLGAVVIEALTPTAIDGIVIGREGGGEEGKE
jgi:alpha-tubulin suppressor-like RCC1 family protein